MDKISSLKKKAETFRALLEANQRNSVDALLLLRWLTPLFEEIAQGRVVPPQRYEYRGALGKDNPFYEPNSPFAEPEAEFAAALEDR